MEIELMVAPGCSSHQPCQEMLRRLRDELAPTARLTVTVVDSPDTARRLRFPGSPTLRIDGRDLEPQAELTGNFGLG